MPDVNCALFPRDSAPFYTVSPNPYSQSVRALIPSQSELLFPVSPCFVLELILPSRARGFSPAKKHPCPAISQLGFASRIHQKLIDKDEGGIACAGVPGGELPILSGLYLDVAVSSGFFEWPAEFL